MTYCKFSSCGCDLFNYRAIKLVTYTVCMCLNRSYTQCVCDKYKRSNYDCNYWLITKGKFQLTGNYNLPLIITLDFLFFHFIYEHYSVFISMQKIWTSYSCSNFVIYFTVFCCYMYWLICSGSYLHILVSFYLSLLCLHTFCIFSF